MLLTLNSRKITSINGPWETQKAILRTTNKLIIEDAITGSKVAITGNLSRCGHPVQIYLLWWPLTGITQKFDAKEYINYILYLSVCHLKQKDLGP